MSNIIDKIQVSGVTYTISGGGGTVSSAITSGDTNPVEGGVLYDELRIPGKVESGLTLEWYNHDGGYVTNYPSGATKLQFEVFASGGTDPDTWEQTDGYFHPQTTQWINDYIHIAINDGVVTAEINGDYGDLSGTTCSVSGNIVTIEYPSSLAENVIGLETSYDNNWTTTAFVNVSGVIPLIDQVSANTAAISGKTDNTAFTAHSGDTTIHHTATSAVTSGSTSVITSGGVYQQMGGMKIVKLTQSAYDALSPNYDSNTIYFIVN